MQQIINHLESNPNNAIVISYNNMKMVNPFMRVNKYEFTKQHIEKGWQSIKEFLKGLKNEGFKSGTQVQLKKPNGTTSKTIGEPITLQFSEDQNSSQMIQSQSNQIPPMPYQGMNGINYGMGGVHPSESKLEALIAKHEDLQERYDDLKIIYKDMRSTERSLREENNSLRIKVDTAEQRKELAILQANLNQKSFMDSEAMKTIAENLVPVLPEIIGRGQNVGQLGMGSANNKLSELKQQFIGFISNEKVQDKDIDLIYKLYKNAVKNQDIAKELQALLIKFQLT